MSQHIRPPDARLVTSTAALPARLTFDIVPTGKAGQFKVFYKGQPLPKTAVHAMVPSGWSKEATTDDTGAVQFDLPWRGVYVLEAQHVDKTGCERTGKAYASATYVTSLTVTQASGVAAVPAGPAMAPGPAH